MRYFVVKQILQALHYASLLLCSICNRKLYFFEGFAKLFNFKLISQTVFTFSKSAMETGEQFVKYVQS